MTEAAVTFKPIDMTTHVIVGLVDSHTGHRYESVDAWVAAPNENAEFEFKIPGLSDMQRHASVQVIHGYVDGAFVAAKLLRLSDAMHGSRVLGEAVVADGDSRFDDLSPLLTVTGRFRTFQAPELMLRELWLTSRRSPA